MSYSYSTTPLFVDEGQTIRFKYKAPSQWDYTETVSISVGKLDLLWFIITVPEDFSPDPFSFRRINESELDTVYVYGDGERPGESIITVSGLTPTTEAPIALTSNYAPASILNFALRIKRNGTTDWEVTPITDVDGWFIPDGTQTVLNGDQIQIKLRSSSDPADLIFADLVIGTGNARWNIETKFIPKNEPEPFPDFTDLFNQKLNKLVYSNVLEVNGLQEAGIVNVDNEDCLIGISSTNDTFTADDGQEVLSGITFVESSTNPLITNGQYLQLAFTTPNVEQFTTNISLSIAEASNGSLWSVETGVSSSTTPNSFSFGDVLDAPEDTLVGSSEKPDTGISGLGEGVEVDVVLVSTTGTEPKIRITDDQGNRSSIGVFPAKVKNGYKITIYERSSAVFDDSVSMQIKVGDLPIPTWTIRTNSGPDTDALFTPPLNLTNRAPNTLISSAITRITGINRPIEISATNGALISIDFDTPVAGPRTFDPYSDTVFQLYLQSSPDLLQTTSTQVTVGTGTTNNPFTWQVTTYAVPPPPKTNLGAWYSKKTNKYDGFSIGTVVPITKEGNGEYGDLSGDSDSRYHGFVECNGQSYPVSQFPDLWWVIGNTFGGDGAYDDQTNTYAGNFNVPDYRNRKLAGMGIVDGNRGSSAFLPVSTVGKGIYDQGAEGGYWYVDGVDVAGPLPFEQIYGEEGATSGDSSPFFTLGTPRTVLNEPVVGDVSFYVEGSVTATVGPLADVFVNTPPHSHYVVTAQVESESGDPLIPWGEPALLGQWNAGIGAAAIEKGSGQDNRNQTGDAVSVYLSALKNYAVGFDTEYAKLGDQVEDLETVILTLTSSPQPNAALGGNRSSITIQIGTWWMTPYSAVADSNFLESRGGGSGRITYPANTDYVGILGSVSQPGGLATAVIDTTPSTFSVDGYRSKFDGGDLASHSHFLTLTAVTDPIADFSYGNSSGPGTKQGLGGSAASLAITFTQNEVQNELNEGQFTLNKNVKVPVPEVEFSPNRQVPLIPPFHKVKYIIKAF